MLIFTTNPYQPALSSREPVFIALKIILCYTFRKENGLPYRISKDSAQKRFDMSGKNEGKEKKDGKEE